MSSGKTKVMIPMLLSMAIILMSGQVSYKHASFLDDLFGGGSSVSNTSSIANTSTILNPLSTPSQSSVKSVSSNCDPSYPDFCIPSPPPDLNCADISQKRFTVTGSDPHGFDRDGDGIGCES
jgi:hypothetical protein